MVQRNYTYKMQTIQTICESYGIPVADTIAPFMTDYDNLAADGVHPNDAGYQVYTDTLNAIISDLVASGEGVPDYSNVTVNESVSQFSNCRYISKKEFARIDNTYTIDIEAEGVFGIDYAYQSGENRCRNY